MTPTSQDLFDFADDMQACADGLIYIENTAVLHANDAGMSTADCMEHTSAEVIIRDLCMNPRQPIDLQYIRWLYGSMWVFADECITDTQIESFSDRMKGFGRANFGSVLQARVYNADEHGDWWDFAGNVLFAAAWPIIEDFLNAGLWRERVPYEEEDEWSG